MNSKEKEFTPPRNRIFLGGGCTSNWRDILIPSLDYYEVDYFNPVVKEWSPECIEIEEEEKEYKCNIHFYYFDKTMKGMYSMAEMMKSCIDIEAEKVHPESGYIYKANHVVLVLFVVNTDGMDESQIRSFDASYNLASKVTRYVLYKKITENSLKSGELANILKDICDHVIYKLADDDNDFYDEDED